MKNCIKIYFHTVVLSSIFIILPWIMAYLNFFSKLNVLEWYGNLFAVIALFISIIYVFWRVKKPVIRFIIIILNPALLYIIAMIFIRIIFSLETWDGFHL